MLANVWSNNGLNFHKKNDKFIEKMPIKNPRVCAIVFLPPTFVLNCRAYISFLSENTAFDSYLQI